jgi:hypothetical protein
MKAGKLAIWPWLVCQYNENTLVDLPSSVSVFKNLKRNETNERATLFLTATVLHADTEIRESISSVPAGPIIFNDEMFSDNSGAGVKYSI